MFEFESYTCIMLLFFPILSSVKTLKTQLGCIWIKNNNEKKGNEKVRMSNSSEQSSNPLFNLFSCQIFNSNAVLALG